MCSLGRRKKRGASQLNVMFNKMKIEAQIKNQITLESYNNYWKSNETPPFSEFMEVLNDRLIGLFEDSESIEELNIKIQSEVANRIRIKGKYLFSGRYWGITGEVVWIPKNNFFKGKLYNLDLGSPYKENPELDLLEDELEKLIESNNYKAYKECIQKIEKIANEGNRDAIEIIAEQYAENDIIQNNETSYFWYHIYYALDDEEPYLTKFENEPDPNYPNHYYGKVGDFRNESMVSDLVEEIGLEKVKIIDVKAEEFLLNLNN